MSKPIKWFSFHNHDATWCVYGSSAEISPADLDPKNTGKPTIDGVAYPNKRIILIDTSSERRTQDYTLLHELMHAALVGSNLSDQTEEKVVMELAPRLYKVLKQFGLVWPERSDDFLTLERKARRALK